MKVVLSAFKRLCNLLLALKRKLRREVIDPMPTKTSQVILVAIILTLIPHVQHLPVSVSVLSAATLLWAVQIHRGVWRLPSLKIKMLLISLFSTAVVLSFCGGFSFDSTVTLFVVGLVLKSLELYNRRHGLVLIFLCYLLTGISFVYQQGIVFAFYQCLVIVWIMTAQLAINSGSGQAMIKMLKQTCVLFLQSVPFTLILFIVIPKLGPLWHSALGMEQGLSGLSDVVAPGDIAQLTRSNELVFRVEFEQGQRPDQRSLYWRGLVLDQFDGRTWRKSYDDRLPRFAPQSYWYAAKGNAITYHIIQEPTGKNWLFGLNWPVPETENTGRTHDFLLVSRNKLFGKLRYQVTSYPDAKVDRSVLRHWQRDLYLKLPKNENPVTHQWIADLKKTHQYDKAIIDAIMQNFRQEPFRYSLTTKPLGVKNTIDRFLFDTKTGFCAHYSGALVYMLRAAGIPSRIVAGYQGGEWNQEREYLTVRQYDAHAWVEAWLPGQGWISLDPTAMVAPERIEQSLQETIGEQAFSEGLGLSIKSENIQWLQDLRFKLEALNYEWTRWTLSYDREVQKSLVKNWLGSAFWSGTSKMFLVVLLIFILLVGFLILLRRRPKLPARIKRWSAFEAWARQQGCERHKYETPMMFGQRIAKVLPYHADSILDFVAIYTQVEYVLNGNTDCKVLLELDDLLKQLRRAQKPT